MEPQAIIARRIARELAPGMLVNLGIGIPTLVANYLPPGINLFFQSENGLVGTGAPPEEGMAHPMLTDAAGHPVTALPGAMVPGMGGAMDLVCGAKRVIVAMQHTAKGRPKIVKQCSLPVTAVRPVDLVVTEMAVVAFSDGRAILRETAPGVSVAEIVAATEAELVVPNDVREMPH